MLQSLTGKRFLTLSGSRVIGRVAGASRTTTAAATARDDAEWEYDHDVVIVGGGIVGCSLACRLAQDAAGAVGASTPSDSKNASSDSDSKGASTHTSTTSRRPFVELIEARPPVPLAEAMAKGKPDPRVYSLTPSSVSVLEGLQVWSGKKGTEADDETLKERSQPFGDMQVWDDRGPGHLCFGEDRKRGGDALGFIAEHGTLHSALFERVQELGGEGLVEMTCPAQVKRVEFPTLGAGGSTGPLKVIVDDAEGKSRTITCRLLVAADGGDSKVAKMLGLPSWGWGYGQRAVVATVRLADTHGETAFQRYLSDGPLAMLPLKDGLASLVWSTTPEHAELLKSMTEEEFLHEVNDALRRPPSAEPSTTTTVSGRSAERSTGRSAENSSRGLPSLPFTLPTTPAAAAGSATAMMDEGPRVGFSKLVGGVSAIAAPPLAAANAIAAGVVKGAEGVASALAGLSLGLGGGGGDGDGGKGGSGFSNPPQAVEVLTPRLGFDLSLRQAHRYTGERAALVGDAAHTVHPMAGQGLNLGIADADALARVIQEGRRSGTDIGSKTLLTRYEEDRKTEALVMMGALDSLHRLFGAEGRAVAAVRSAGLSALNVAGPVKSRLARHAMGGGK